MLAAALPQCSSLRTLEYVLVKGLQRLATGLPLTARRSPPSIHSFPVHSLSSNKLGAAGMRLVASALPECASFQALK